MASSSYYFAQMNGYSQDRRRCSEKKQEYKDYVKKLKLLFSNLDGIYGNLVSCANYFKDGGYIVNGVTLDQGVLDKNYELLATIVVNLNSVISKTENRIQELSNDVNRYERLYEQARINYNNAKRRESMEE